NLSAALSQPSVKNEGELQSALDYAAQQAAIVVAAAGNHGTVGGSVITRHPWVIPVAACDRLGRPLDQSNLSNSIGKRGVWSPGDNVPSLGSAGEPVTVAGTSAAAPLVTGTVALPTLLADCLRDRLNGRIPYVPEVLVSELGHRGVALGAT